MALAPWRRLLQLPVRAITALLLLLIAFYQRAISPWLGPCCRFTPSCSAYAVECLRRHGLLRAVGWSIWRVLRCNPYCRGGYDPPPEGPDAAARASLQRSESGS